MRFFAAYIKQRRRSIGAFILFTLIFLAAFVLYHLPAEAVAYPALVCGLLGLIFVIRDYRKAWLRHSQLEGLLRRRMRITSGLSPCFLKLTAGWKMK